MKIPVILAAFLALSAPSLMAERTTYNFNSDWQIAVGTEADAPRRTVTLPRAFNQEEAFRLKIDDLTDTVTVYTKTFRLPASAKGKKVFIEFEGIRQAGDFYLNGQHLGLHENGVMAVGFDLTPYIKYSGDNELKVVIDNDWSYHERATDTPYQWNNKNFNANYGGIPKNVRLHITEPVYQTLPLYSNLGTTGVYVYASDIDVDGRSATINTETEVRNESGKPETFTLRSSVVGPDGKTIATFSSRPMTLAAGETGVIKASGRADGLHFWSWGYGYLYDVATELVNSKGEVFDRVNTVTGFRKTRFADGQIWLNDRVIQMKGYAQRTSNEWPGVGMSVPPWLSDYSNALMVESGANLVRWMHVTPWKQDVESCDRVGLIQAMPAGDAEKDVEGRRWEQRKALMRDAIIYNRNNPSILFYESGNESISEPHMAEMKEIRDTYDPHGGRAIGSREMLDSRIAEYGGEMLYINKSARHPMWATEYCRDEGLRKYWDEYSYPFHKEGDGPLYRNASAADYNHNQDAMAVELIRRWYDYWRERPGTGTRVSSGGAKIIFSDTNTHFRGAENYRRSGVTDPMRIEKDGFFVHQTMWDCWVDPETPHTYIIGHWNYPDSTVKPVYVASNGERVELRLNGKTIATDSVADYRFLYTFPDVAFEPGTLEAVSFDAAGDSISSYRIETAGAPAALRLTTFSHPDGMRADGADLGMVQVEVVDADGRRCPLDNRLVKWTLDGAAEWIGGIAQGPDNYIGATELPVECGVNRILFRAMPEGGTITLTATAEGLAPQTVSFDARKVETTDGLSLSFPHDGLKGLLTRGETPKGASFTPSKTGVEIIAAKAASGQEDATKSYDDNELSEWHSDGHLRNAAITYTLARPAEIAEICIKLTGWRKRSYPLEIYAGDTLVWSGETDKSLGYVHLPLASHKPSDTFTLRLKGSTDENEAFGQITELDPNQELDLFKDTSEPDARLRIVEIEFLENL